MRKTTLLLPGLTAAALLALACGSGGGGGDTPPPNTPPVVTPPATSPPDAGPVTGNVELTQFARMLVEQDTSDTAKPRELGGLTFVDSEDANAFPESFFTPQ